MIVIGTSLASKHWSRHHPSSALFKMAPVQRKRRTQLQLLLGTFPAVGVTPPDVTQPPIVTPYVAPPVIQPSSECLCFPEDPERAHKRCWRNLSKEEALLRANYAASRTSNAMAQLMHNALHMRSPPALKKPTWTIPYPCRCCYPSRFGLHSHQIKGHVDSVSSEVSSEVHHRPYRKICMECKPNYLKTIVKVMDNNPAALDIFREHGILPSEGDIICPKDQSVMRLNMIQGKWVWRCNKRIKIKKPKRAAVSAQCNHKLYHTTGSILAQTRLQPWQVLLFIQEYVEKDFKLETTCRKLGLKSGPAERLKAYLDEVCAFVCESQDPIGGSGSTVEIDETLIVKKKKAGRGENHQAREPPKPVWILGGKERYGAGFFALPLIIEETSQDGKSVVVTTDGRTSASLIPKLQKYILPGSFVMTDGWPAYSKFGKYPRNKQRNSRFRYKQFRVNHNLEFVREDNPWIHTNCVERFWKDLKDYAKRPGMRRHKIKSYIGRYLIINRRRQGEVRRCTTQKQRKVKRQFIADTAFHRMLEAIENYARKMRT